MSDSFFFSKLDFGYFSQVIFSYKYTIVLLVIIIPVTFRKTNFDGNCQTLSDLTGVNI